MKTTKWYENQIEGLALIIQKGNGSLSRRYVLEKLGMIKKDGVNFHPIIQNQPGINNQGNEVKNENGID